MPALSIPSPHPDLGSEPSAQPKTKPTALREWPTVCLYLGVWVMGAVALIWPGETGLWAFLLLVPALTLHSSLSHEILHGHPVRARWAQTALGIIQPGLFVPYLRFRALHLAHHEDSKLTDPYDDPESNYFDPDVWDRLPSAARLVLTANNTLAGRMVLGPLIGLWQFYCDDLRRIRQAAPCVAFHWMAHLPGVVLTLWAVYLSAVPLWVYLLACYAAMSILKIRTFLEHRAHTRASARTVVIEDRGLLALLFLNNNYHVVHHMHPKAAWYDLPALYRSQKTHYLRRNDGYVYRSYGQIFRAFLWRSKDPVAHPLWRAKE